MGDTPQQDPKSYDLNDFDTEGQIVDKNTVLGTDSSIGTETGQIAWETYGKELETLVSYRDSINAESVRNKATSWRGHGDSLTALAGQFSNEVKSKIIDSWDSDGGASASAAVQRYADQLSVLPVVIKAIANSLDFSADFLDTTRKNIPDAQGKLVDGTSIVETSGDYETDETRAQLRRLLTERANEVMNQVFVPGGKSVDAAMPVFPLPKPVTEGLPDPGPGGQRPGGQQPGGQQPGGRQPGGQQPGQQLQSAALDQAEQQRQELQAARQELEKQAELQQAALQQQQQQLEQQPGAQQMLQAAQQGLQQLGQMGEQLSTAAQQALQQAGITGLPGMPALQDAVKNYQSALQKSGKLPAGLGGGPGGGSPGSSLAAKGAPVPNMEKAAKLFPRASLAGTTTGQSVGVVAAQTGQQMPMGGMPMGGGGAGGAAQGGQQKDHKRADYLDSTEWLEEGIGDAQIVAKPVVDQ